MNHAPKMLVAGLLLLVAALVVISALPTSGPSWNPLLAYRNNTMNCSWQVSPDLTEQNITILNGSAAYYFTSETSSFTSTYSVPGGITRHGEIWTCRVTQSNGTIVESRESSITIENSAPTTPSLYRGGVNMGTIISLTEDQAATFTLNSSDQVDQDELMYRIDTLNQTSFCVVTPDGAVSCTPTHSAVRISAGNQSERITGVLLKFWAEDNYDYAKASSVPIIFNITPVNDPPAATLDPQRTDVNQSLSFTFGVTDEEANVPYAVQIVAAPQTAEIEDKLAVAPVTPGGSLMRVTYDATIPDFGDIGLWNVSIRITDNSTDANGADNSRSVVYGFMLNITPVGRAPFFTNITPAGPYTVQQGDFLQINLSANEPDPNVTLDFTDNTNAFNVVALKRDTNTSDATAQINFTPTNAYVGVYNVTITVYDVMSTLANTTVLEFHVTNRNDPPVIHEMSNRSTNTHGNANASSLTAYANTPFVYDLNATDPDLGIVPSAGETLAFSSNSTIFAINATSGRISFTPTDAQVQTGYAVNVTVRDTTGEQHSRIFVFNILNNSPPRFDPGFTRLNLTTKVPGYFNLSTVASDPDSSNNDYVAEYDITVAGDLASFAYNKSTGIISFTPLKPEVGTYQLNIVIYDTHGAFNSTTVELVINTTPERPNLTRYDFSASTVVETHLFSYELRATDDDLLTPAGDNVTFTTNLTLPHTIDPLPGGNSTARALLSFAPEIGDAGSYSLLINATDSFGLSSSKVVSFTIYPKVPPPNITKVTPWGLDTPGHELQTSYQYTDAPVFRGMPVAPVGFGEDNTVLFSIAVNDTRPASALTYSWTINGTPAAGSLDSPNYTKSFDFFSSGRHIVKVTVANDRLENSSWTWNVTVADVNRPPNLTTNLTDPPAVNGTITIQNFFAAYDQRRYFVDPDDDLNSNGKIDDNETNTLTFGSNGLCDNANLAAIGVDLKISGTKTGSCIVIFNATDAYGAASESNPITINITDVPLGQAPAPTVTSNGGGGSSSTTSTFIPLNKKIESPKAFNIIAPKLVTVYSNKSVTIPIIINNTWNAPLKMVRISAETNISSVTASFDTDLFEEIPMNTSKEVTMTVANYRLGQNYEVIVKANVTSPKYEDQALILLNSIEQSEEGKDVSVKVTFANDLVNEHPECAELNDVLSQAKRKIAEGNLHDGEQLVTSVIEGCKYLVSTQQRIQEKPTHINPIINIDDLSVKAMMLGVLAFVVLSSIAFLIYYHYTHKPEDDI